jgi:hypothetical protein
MIVMARLRRPVVFIAPGTILILVAIGGRYTLDRAGLQNLAWVDLRVIGLIAGLAVLAIDLARRRPVVSATGPRAGWSPARSSSSSRSPPASGRRREPGPARSPSTWC